MIKSMRIKPFLLSMVVVGLLLLSMMVTASPVVANGFAGGDGSELDPYQIVTWNHMNEVRNNLSSHFILVNDLDEDTAGYADHASATANSNEGWLPTGNFVGNFNGQGYELRDFVINRSGTGRQAIFGYLGWGGTIRNLGIANATVTGGSYTGALVGLAHQTNPLVEHCYVRDSSVTGGLNCGGLVGRVDSGTAIVRYSYARGVTVTGSSDATGGLVGNQGPDSIVSQCFVDSVTVVSSNVRGGSIIGRNAAGTTINCYSTGSSVTRSDGTNTEFGSAVGQTWQGKQINILSTASVHYTGVDDPTDRGFLGSRDDGGDYEVSNCFWDTETSGQATSRYGEATGLTTANAQDYDTYNTAGWDIVRIADHDGEEATAIWYIDNDNDYPRLWFEWEPFDGEPPSVSTNAATSVLSHSGTLEGEITGTGGQNSSWRGFEWGTSTGSYSWSYNVTGDFGIGEFSHGLTDLTPGRTYYYRAFAENAAGIGYGDEVSFTTNPWPTVTTGRTVDVGRDWVEVERSWTVGVETPLVVWMEYRHSSDLAWLSTSSSNYSTDGESTIYLNEITEAGRWDYRVAANYTDEGGGTLYGSIRQFDMGPRDEFERMPTWYPFVLLGICLLVFVTRSLLLCIGGVIAALIGFWMVFDPGMNSLPGLGFSALMLLIIGWMMWRVVFSSDWTR